MIGFSIQSWGESEYKTRYRRFLTGNRVFYGSVKHSKDKMIINRVRNMEKQLGRKIRDDDVLYDFDIEFKQQGTVIYEPIIRGNAKERTGWCTQKPLALYSRMILAATNAGDVVLDPFCGCATTLVAAENAGRQWIGIDRDECAGEMVVQQLTKLNEGSEDWLRKVIVRNDIPVRTDAGKID